MALRLPQVPHSTSSWSTTTTLPESVQLRSYLGLRSSDTVANSGGAVARGLRRGGNNGGEKLRVVVPVRASLETVGGDTLIGKVTEVNKDTFWPIVNSAGEKAVVVDMYTQWCGPCKVIAPKYQELSEKYHDIIFLKLDCNQENKPLAKELGIRVVPTFKILKDKKIVKEITGAKFDDLVAAIEVVRTSLTE